MGLPCGSPIWSTCLFLLHHSNLEPEITDLSEDLGLGRVCHVVDDNSYIRNVVCALELRLIDPRSSERSDLTVSALDHDVCKRHRFLFGNWAWLMEK